MNGEKSRYTHILFDLDGTLSDPKEGITGVYRASAARQLSGILQAE